MFSSIPLPLSLEFESKNLEGRLEGWMVTVAQFLKDEWDQVVGSKKWGVASGPATLCSCVWLGEALRCRATLG